MTAERAEISGRRAEVLGLLGERLSNAQIAGRLHISVRTVESHVSSLLRSYGVADRAALASIAGPTRETAPRPGLVAGLPRPRTTFIGRMRDSEAVLAALEHARLVTLVGPGGVGKTRLATAVAALAVPAFPIGGAFVDLVPVSDGFIAQAVAASLGVSESPQQSLTDAIAHRLGRGRSLLILDNCEHVLEAVAELVERIGAGCPDLTILATSRERLAFPGEQIVPVAPLPLASDAEQLFLDRALTIDPGFTADPAILGEVCSRLDGMPLAIELAAARAASLGADGLLTGLDDCLRLLAGSRGTPERHRSLRAVIDWSHSLLDEDERALLRHLAVFAGSFDLDAATAVTHTGDRSTVADLLGRLVEKSMVGFHRGAVRRWRLLATIRAFALEHLRADADQARVRERHLRWAAGVAVELEARLDGDWRIEFDTVAADLREALAGCAGPDSDAHRLARALGHLTYARRFLREAAGHYQRAAELAPDPGEAARDLRHAADATLVGTNSGTQAFDWLLASAEHAGAAGDPDARAIALARAVETASRFHADPAAEVPRERLRELLEDARADPAPNRPGVQAALAVAAAWTSSDSWRDPDPELAQLAATMAHHARDPVLVSAALDAMSAAATRAGRLRQAHRVAGERLAMTTTMSRNDPYPGPEVADALHMAATYAIAAGDLPAARSAARLVYSDELVGSHPYASVTKLITALVLSGSLEEALGHAAAMWDGWLRAGRPVGPATAPAVLAVALAHGLLGNAPDVTRWRGRALEVLGVGDIGEAPGLAPFAAFVDARIAVHTGDLGGAAALIERAYGNYPLSRHETYARAAGAELAVVAGLPAAEERLAIAAPAADENDWAAACLIRARGRLHRDVDLLAASARAWERIGARFELDRTRELIADLTGPG